MGEKKTASRPPTRRFGHQLSKRFEYCVPLPDDMAELLAKIDAATAQDALSKA